MLINKFENLKLKETTERYCTNEVIVPTYSDEIYRVTIIL